METLSSFPFFAQAIASLRHSSETIGKELAVGEYPTNNIYVINDIAKRGIK